MNHDEMLRALRNQGEHPLMEQLTGEPIDFFAMRAFIVALKRADPIAARAMHEWMKARGDAHFAAHSPFTKEP